MASVSSDSRSAGSPFATGDVVFTFSYETLADARARGLVRPPDRILGSLLAHPGVRRLVIANPYRSFAAAALRRVRDPGLARAERSENVFSPLRLRRADAVDLGAIERTYRAYDRALSAASHRAEQQSPDLITTHPLVAGFSPADWTGGRLYFGRDDWASFPPRQQYWPAYHAAYSRIAASGMPVAAVSQQIIERIAPRGEGLVVPNGIDPSEWLNEAPAAPAWFTAIPLPRAVYVGTLDSRLDVAGLRVLASAKPDVQLVLIGPIPEPELLRPLRALDNVHLHESVGRTEVVGVLRHAQVGLVAHRRTALTEAMSPLKAYEYAAAGLPVLSVDLAPVRAIGTRVVLTESVGDFVDAIDTTLALGTASEQSRAEFIEENSWARRHDAMFELLRRR